MKIISKNRRASFRYHILETFDGGLVLTGPEVKSLRAGKVILEDGFGKLDKGNVVLWNVHIAVYKQGSLHVEQNPTRTRRVLLNKNEIKKISSQLAAKGLALIPLEMYFSDSGYAKVRLGLGKGKKTHDKRETIKKRETEREMRRSFSGRHKI